MECSLYVMYVSINFICINFSALQNAPGGGSHHYFFPFRGEGQGIVGFLTCQGSKASVCSNASSLAL